MHVWAATTKAMESQHRQTIVQDHPRGHQSSSSGGGSPRTSPEPSRRPSHAAAPPPISSSIGSNKMGLVTIFTKEDCIICEAAKDELMIRNIPYQEITLDASETQPVPEFFLNNDPVPGGLEELVNLIEETRRIERGSDNNNNNSHRSRGHDRDRAVLHEDSARSYYDVESSRQSPNANDDGLGGSQRSFHDPMGESRKSHGDSDEDFAVAVDSLSFHHTGDDKYHDSMASITEELYNESYSTAYSRERSLPEHSRSFQQPSTRRSQTYDNSHRSLSFEEALQISKNHLSSRNLSVSGGTGHHSNSSNNSSGHVMHKDLNESNQSLSTEDILPVRGPLRQYSTSANQESTIMGEDSMPALMPLGMSSSSRISTSMNSSSRLNSSVKLTNIRRRMQDSTSTIQSGIMQESFNNSMSSSVRSAATTSSNPETKTPIELPNKKRKLSVFDAMKELQSVLPCTDKKYGLTVYRNCFTGSECVDILSQHYELPRSEASALATHLNQSTLIHHVIHEHEFEDTNKYFYRLQCYQTPEIMNSYCIWTHQETRTKHGKVVIERLHEQLQEMFVAIADPTTGKINYREARNQKDKWEDLDYRVCELQLVNLARMDKKSLMAFALNVYQLFWHLALMKFGIPTTAAARNAFLSQVKFNVGGDIYSFSDWWNGILRGNRKSPYGGGVPFKPAKDPRVYLSLPSPVEPRIHFAAAMTQLARPLKVYTTNNLDKQLQVAANVFCSLPEFVSLDVDAKTLKLHHCFDAYTSDFASSTKALPAKIVQWMPRKTQKQFESSVKSLGKSTKVVFRKDDDWSHHAGKFEPFDETKELKADTKRLLTKSNSLRRLFAS